METKTVMSKGISFGTLKIYERGKAINYGNNKIIIATNEDLMASDTLSWDWDKISGIITTKGTKNSHSAIVAKQHEVPAAVVGNISELQDGDFIAIDTNSSEIGNIYIHPSKKEVESLLKKLELLKIQNENLSQYKVDSTSTKDGHKVFVVANIGTIDELPSVKNNYAEGIGVVRTEFSYEMYDMFESRLPTEDELYNEYKKISDELAGKNVIIRTLDAGADKPVSSLIKAGVLKENEVNPALGSRGIRPCLKSPEILKTQIKAILRANAENKNLQIMFPMITSIEELKEGKEIINEAVHDLKKQGVKFAECSIGTMVETPAIAQITDKLSKYCDFISVGTNDLTQYTTAADRMNNSVESIANPYNPGMVRVLNNIISGAHSGQKSILCGVCGEIAGDPNYIPLLIGMGLDEFSMNSSSILEARRLISHLTQKECKKLLEDVLALDTPQEIQEQATKFYIEKNLEILAEEKQQKQDELENVVKRETEIVKLRDKYRSLIQEDLPKYLREDDNDGWTI